MGLIRLTLFKDSLRILSLVLGSLILALLFNWFHPMKLPIFQGEVKRPGVPEFIWKQTKYVGPKEAFAQVTGGRAVLVDARDAEDYAKRRARSAISLPYHGYEASVEEFERVVDKGRPVYIYCYGSECGLSIRVAKRLILRGYKEVRVVRQGLEAWEKAGLPVDEEPLSPSRRAPHAS
jgi:rhodanese-related sulfurtransferase